MRSIRVPQLKLKGRPFQLSVPSSKSIANRALILAALSKGKFKLIGDFEAEDIQLMIGSLQKLGVKIAQRRDGLSIENDLSWKQQRNALRLFLGNSGTSIRFLTSLVCLRNGRTVLTGKQRMKERPIKDLVDALRQLGAEVHYLERDGFPPIEVKGHGTLRGGRVNVKAQTSSQFLTSLLLIEPALEKKLQLNTPGKIVSQPYIDMTRALVRRWRAGADFTVEGDASAAVYWWALAFLHGVTVEVSNVPSRSMQGDVKFLSLIKRLKSHKTKTTLSIDMNDMPDASLMLMAMVPLLRFPITITGIGSLRVKETDRIAAMAKELGKLGVKVEVGKDWMKIWPLLEGDFSTSPRSKNSSVSVEMTKKIETYDDHRIAMSFAVLGTRLGNLEIMDPDCVRKTYPKFWRDLKRFR